MERRWTFHCGLILDNPSMADRKWQTILDDRASVRKCATPAFSFVGSRCVNEQMSGKTVRECTAEEDLQDVFIILGIHTNKQLKCCHTKYG